MGEIVVFDEFVNQRQPRSWAVSHGHGHRSVLQSYSRMRLSRSCRFPENSLTPRVRPAVIGDDLEFVRKNICNGGIRTSVSAAARDQEEWPPYSAQFKIELIAFGCYAL